MKMNQAAATLGRLGGLGGRGKSKVRGSSAHYAKMGRKGGRKGKGRSKPRTPLVAPLSEDRILQLSNDLSEGIKSGNVQEWRAVALYFRRQLDRAYNDINGIRPSVAAYVAARNILKTAGPEMESWLQRVKS